ncbi:MAG: hypothetical protein AAFP76_16600 [Bacteroidota bacterium]
MSMFHYYDLGYAEAFIFDQFLINQIREGVTITPRHNKKLEEIIDKHFKNRPVVYISNRINSYAVNPITYIDTSKIHNLLAMAIVADTDINKKNAIYESSFYKKPFQVFETLSEAMAWVHQIIRESND